MPRIKISVSSLLAVGLQAGVAFAQPPPPPGDDEPPESLPADAPPPPGEAPPPPPPPAERPSIDLDAPPPPPPMKKNRHYHDGFYARLSLGPSMMATTSTFDDVDGSVTFRGFGFSVDAMMGGTVAPGLVIGGAVLVQDAVRPSHSVNDTDDPEVDRFATRNDTLHLVLLGPMVDGFPDPDEGFHIGGMIGPASVGVQDDGSNSSTGFGLSVWLGYGWWVSSQWSLGITGRLAGARTGLSLGFSDSIELTRALTLMFTALYH